MRMWHCFKNNIKTEKHFNGKHYLCPALYKCAKLNDNLSVKLRMMNEELRMKNKKLV